MPCQHRIRSRAKSVAAALASSSGSAHVIAGRGSVRLNAGIADDRAVLLVFFCDLLAKLVAVTEIDGRSQGRHPCSYIGQLGDFADGSAKPLNYLRWHFGGRSDPEEKPDIEPWHHTFGAGR